MFKYSPRDASGALDSGTYEAEISSAEEMVSKEKQKPMLKITYTIPWNNREYTVEDYIVAPTGIWKYRKLAEALHQEREFEDGRFDITEHLGRPITLTLEFQAGKDGFPDKNRVTKYAESSGMPPSLPITPNNAMPATGDEVPF